MFAFGKVLSGSCVHRPGPFQLSKLSVHGYRLHTISPICAAPAAHSQQPLRRDGNGSWSASGRKRTFGKEDVFLPVERPAKISKGAEPHFRGPREGPRDGRREGPWVRPARDGARRDGPREAPTRDGPRDRHPPPPPPKQPSHQAPVYLTKVPIVRPGNEDKGTFYSSNSFKRVGATDEVVKALQSLGIRRPSHIQAQSLLALAAGGPNQVVLADAAGSGKTLAYLLPLLQQLRETEAANNGPVTRPHQPSIVVVCPTTELAQQVFRVVRALSKGGLKARSAAFTATTSGNYRTQKDTLKAGVDIVICTPLRLTALMEFGDLSLVGCNALVLDEVDILLGDTSAFAEQVEPLLEAGGPNMRLVMVTATLPDHTFDQLRRMFPNMAAAFGPGLHKVAPGLVEELVDCSGGEEVSLESGTQRKLVALLSVLQQHKAQRALVFCNKIEICRRVENFLQRQDRKGEQYQVLAYHAAINKAGQQAALDKFLAEDKEGGVPMYLVCTDRTSRGLDSILCEHVVLFDFPRDPSEYVRRVGRTARGAGGTGTVSVLVLGKQVPLAKSILERNRKGGTVHRIPLTYTPWRPPRAPGKSASSTPGLQARAIEPPSAQDYDDYAEQIGRALHLENLQNTKSGDSESSSRVPRTSQLGDDARGRGDGYRSMGSEKAGGERAGGERAGMGGDAVGKCSAGTAAGGKVSGGGIEVAWSGTKGAGSVSDEREAMDELEFEDEDEDEFWGGDENGIEPGHDFVVVKAPSRKKP